jgi:hypothetical protein
VELSDCFWGGGYVCGCLWKGRRVGFSTAEQDREGFKGSVDRWDQGSREPGRRTHM